jgi:hypothetical protein
LAREIRQIADAAWLIVRDPRATRIERLEALKLIAGCKGVLLPDIDEKWLTVRQVTQLRRIRQELVEKALRRKAARQRQNRRAFLRRRIKTLENQEGENVGRSE